MYLFKLTIKFDTNTILKNPKGGQVIKETVNALKRAYKESAVVLDRAFHYCDMLVASELELTDESVMHLLEEIDIIDCREAEIKLENISAEEAGDKIKNSGKAVSAEEKEFYSKHFGILFKESEEVNRGENVKEACTTYKTEVENLIGLDVFVDWMKETEKISEKYKDIVKSSGMMQNTAYLISINRGNGLTTLLELMGEKLNKTGLAEFSGKKRYIEWKLSYTDREEDFSSFSGLLDRIDHMGNPGSHYKGILAINMEEWLDHILDKRIDILLKYAWENRNDYIFVFTMPYAEASVVERLYARINDVLCTKVMKFVPPSDKQYFEYFKRFMERYELSVNENAFNGFMIKITNEKNDGRFYGFNTVKKICNEVIYSIISEAVKGDSDIRREITEDVFSGIYDLDESDGISGMEQLMGMVALDEVKERIKEILSSVKLQRELYSEGKAVSAPCYHMMFTGNPGTGKTVVARIVGRIFKEEGILELGNFFEVSRKDFIGKFVGHTAPKTMEICRNARGSVLFIDEAYLLADERDGYSSEAIGTLIAEMENNRDNMIVIFAGYEKELENLFDMNPGLRDRIPYKINFPNYNREELKKIFYMQLRGKVERTEEFDRKAEEFFDKFPEDVLEKREFSNGRFVRNLAERIMSKAALRFEISGIDINDFKLTESDFSVAVADRDFMMLMEKGKTVRKMGF